MLQRFAQLGSALYFHSVGALVERGDDHTGVDELAFDGAQLVLLVVAGVVVDDGHKVVANVSFLLVAFRVGVGVVGHQCGDVKDDLHHVVLPHVGVVTVTVFCVEATDEGGLTVDVAQANQRAEAVQKIGIS